MEIWLFQSLKENLTILTTAKSSLEMKKFGDIADF